MARMRRVWGVWLGVASLLTGCGGHVNDADPGAGGRGGAGGGGSADAAPDPTTGDAADAGSIGARAVAEFERALRAFCKCDDDPDLDCFDWATRFQGESRDCYIAFLDRHAAEGLAGCVLDTAKSIGDCLQSCAARCDSALLLDDSPMADILYDRCLAPPSYREQTDDCSGP